VSKIKWPKSVPISPEIGDMLLKYDDGSPCCLLGHAFDVFPGGVSGSRLLAVREIGLVAVGIMRAEYSDVAEWNDTHTPEERQRVWNQAMANLGYTEGNPEKPTRKAGA
jgi:hypothetical protein